MRVFLGHSSVDKPLANNIYNTLRNQAVDVWFDRFELLPGDSILTKIGQGISKADYLLVLVSNDSKKSDWVKKELKIALEKGLTIIPLLLEGCSLPDNIKKDIKYININTDGGGINDIIPAIFRGSYILDISLKTSDLTCDTQNLRDKLYEYTRSNLNNIHVRINNNGFNNKILALIEHFKSNGNIAIVDGREQLQDMKIKLTIFWVNLSALISRLLNQIFSHRDKNMDTVSMATTAVSLAHWTLHNDGCTIT